MKEKIKSFTVITIIVCIFTLLNKIEASEMKCSHTIMDMKPLSITWVQESEHSWI